MSELKIPNEAYSAACRSMLVDVGSAAGLRYCTAVDAAAPLIVAAELRRLANELAAIPQHSTNCTTASDFIHHIRTYAYLLDPESVTK